MPKYRITYEIMDPENWGDIRIEDIEAESEEQAKNKFRKEHAKLVGVYERHDIVKVEEIKNQKKI